MTRTPMTKNTKASGHPMLRPLGLLLLALWLAPVHAAEPPLQLAAADEGSAAGAGANRSAGRGFKPVLRWGLDGVLVEAGRLVDAPEARSTATARVSPFVAWQPAREWEFRAGARLEAVTQRDGPGHYDDSGAELTDTFVRYRRGDTRLTLGAQTVLWGRVDAVPTIDRVSRVDLSRFVLDDLAERRLPQPMLRWEQSFEELKLDAIVMPGFKPALLPDLQSVWSPIDRRGGRVFGLPQTPAIGAIARFASLREDLDGSGGAAVRVTRAGAPVDLGLTLAHTRQPLPYYRLDPLRMTLTRIQPYNKFVGADMEFVAGGVTLRSELGTASDVPATRLDGSMATGRSWDWIGAVEFFPGGKDTRVNLQLLTRQLRVDGPVLELKRYTGVNGEVQTSFGQGRWKLGLRFASGLNVHDVYLSPRLSYVGWEPHEFFITAHHFRGEDRTLGGFHREHGMVAVGVKTRF
ncbi:MAG: hypothetical protein HY855_08035 [Burkholderiales bacterium]|nr:hypothetical protein [Burkholderiales bacterium]